VADYLTLVLTGVVGAGVGALGKGLVDEILHRRRRTEELTGALESLYLELERNVDLVERGHPNQLEDEVFSRRQAVLEWRRFPRQMFAALYETYALVRSVRGGDLTSREELLRRMHERQGELRTYLRERLHATEPISTLRPVHRAVPSGTVEPERILDPAGHPQAGGLQLPLTVAPGLDTAILEARKQPGLASRVRQRLMTDQVYALGYPAGDMAMPGMGTESDLLHFTIDDESKTERVMLPVFTRVDVMREALKRNPDWQTLMVLQVNGAALLENVDQDVVIVVNPWSPLEFQLPPPHRRVPSPPAGAASAPPEQRG
jgi:hypothetical protein